ncbi:MAG: hypothetical protein ACQEXX_19885 [Bacillota bacterium]
MNNQVKITDTEKLIAHMDKFIDKLKTERDSQPTPERRLHLDGMVSGLAKYHNLLLAGAFDADPTPMPTIKPGDKVKHKKYKEGLVRSDIEDGKVWVTFDVLDYDLRLPIEYL